MRHVPTVGAAMTAETPSAALTSTARAALRTASRIGGAPCLTRIDLVETSGDGGPIVMEVELIEPMLFFGYAPGSAARAASALVGGYHAAFIGGALFAAAAAAIGGFFLRPKAAPAGMEDAVPAHDYA